MVIMGGCRWQSLSRSLERVVFFLFTRLGGGGFWFWQPHQYTILPFRKMTTITGGGRRKTKGNDDDDDRRCLCRYMFGMTCVCLFVSVVFGFASGRWVGGGVCGTLMWHF